MCFCLVFKTVDAVFMGHQEMSHSCFRYGTQPNHCKSRLTASTPEGLDELHRFQPNSLPQVRRSSSLEDIARFNQYFLLIQSNNGLLFTWRHYLEILQEQLCSFETFAILSKALLPRLPSRKLQSDVDMSVYFTPPATVTTSEEDIYEVSQGPTQHRVEADCHEDERSVVSETSSKSFGSRIRIMKKICSEMKVLARKISKTVAIMSSLPEVCAECGAHLRTAHHLKHCSLQSLCEESVGDMADIIKKGSSILHWNDECNSSFTPSIVMLNSARGAGEMTPYPTKSGKKGLKKKSSIKRLAHLCKQYVRRR